MVTIGTLRYDIVADTSQFTQGMTAGRRELRAAEAAFISSRTPAERLGLQVSQLSELFNRGALSAQNYQRAVATQGQSQGLTGQIAAMEQAQRETRQMASAMKSAASESGKFSMAEQAKVTQLNRTAAAMGPQIEALRQQQRAQAAQEAAQSRSAIAAERAARADALRQQVMQRGSQITRSMETDTDRYNREMQELGMLLRRGAIDQQTFNRAASQASGRLNANANAQAERERQALMQRGLALTRQVETATDRYGRELAELNQLQRAGAISSQTYQRAIRQIQSQNAIANGGIRGTVEQFRNMPQAMSTAVKGFVAYRAAGMAASQVKDAFSLASDIESTTMAFEVLTGSADRAASLVRELRTYDAQTTFNFADTTQAAQKLLNFGVQVQDVVPNLRALGDISLGNSDKLSRLALAFGQTTSMGRLMGGEVRQMVEAGFNPLQEIAKTTGESMGELQKRMEGGGVSADELTAAIISVTSEGGRFFGMVEKRAQTTSGQLDLLTGEFDMLKANLAAQFLPAVNEVLGVSSQVLSTWGQILEGDFSIDAPKSMTDWMLDNINWGALGFDKVQVIGGDPNSPNAQNLRVDPAIAEQAKERKEIQVAVDQAKQFASPVAEPIMNTFSGIEELFKKAPQEHEEDKRHREAMKSRNDVLARLQRLIEVQPAAVE